MSMSIRRPARVVALLFLPVVTTACWALPFTTYRGLRGQEEGFDTKVVSAKQEPSRLVAADQTGCEVSEADFQRIREGEKHFCFWRADASDVAGASTQPERRVTTTEDLARDRAAAKPRAMKPPPRVPE